MPMLIVHGIFGSLDMTRRLAWRGRRPAAGVLAATVGALLLGVTIIAPAPESRPLLVNVVRIVAGLGGIAALVVAVVPARRVAGVLAPVVALALVAVATSRAHGGLARRATFQRPQMERARETLREAVEAPAVVITTEEVGRPAENIEYYSGVAHSLYLTDLARWRIPLREAMHTLVDGGLRPYLLLPADSPRTRSLIESLDLTCRVTLVADIPPPEAINYFVAAAFHRGVHMGLWRVELRPVEEILQKFDELNQRRPQPENMPNTRSQNPGAAASSPSR